MTLATLFIAFIATSSAPDDMASAQPVSVHATEADCRAAVVDEIYPGSPPDTFAFCREFVGLI